MQANAFIGHAAQPTAKELAGALGASQKAWDQLIEELADELEATGQEWNSYSVKAGWALKLKRKDRNIVYLGPRQGGFLASFILGDKALVAARQSKLPAKVVKLIQDAKRYPEGTAVRIEVKTLRDVGVVKKLAKAKLVA